MKIYKIVRIEEAEKLEAEIKKNLEGLGYEV